MVCVEALADRVQPQQRRRNDRRLGQMAARRHRLLVAVVSNDTDLDALYPTLARLANPANTTVGYQEPTLIREAVACYWHRKGLQERVDAAEQLAAGLQRDALRMRDVEQENELLRARVVQLQEQLAAPLGHSESGTTIKLTQPSREREQMNVEQPKPHEYELWRIVPKKNTFHIFDGDQYVASVNTERRARLIVNCINAVLADVVPHKDRGSNFLSETR